jgi:hypothetical protein
MAQAPQVSGDRMFGAIVLRGDKAWFFKAVGSREALTPHAEKLIDFVKSVRFQPDGTPTWTLPDDWTASPGNAFRYATLILGKDAKPPELSVTVLPKNEADDAYILANVNRWRGQLRLPPTTTASLKRESLEIPLAEGQSALVVVLAAGVDAAPNGGPSAGGGPIHASAKPMTLKSYETPAGWTDRGASGDRQASLAVGQGDEAVDASITSFSAEKEMMTNPIANINRWRRQLQLPEATPDEIAVAAQEVSVSGHRGVYIEMFAPNEADAKQATFAVMFRAGSDVWFVKLTGNAATANRQRDAFKRFLDSIRLEAAESKPQGARDGK